MPRLTATVARPATGEEFALEKTLQELANLVGGQLIGDESIVITETRSFEQAVKQSITFAIGEYVEHIALCQAGAVIVESEVKNGEGSFISVLSFGKTA